MRRMIPLFLASLFVSPAIQAAPTLYVFDTVTSVGMGFSTNTVSGTEKDTGDPLSVSYVDSTIGDYRYLVNRCTPLLLTMLEKPGRYFLYLTVDPAELHVQMVECRLTVKT